MKLHGIPLLALFGLSSISAAFAADNPKSEEDSPVQLSVFEVRSEKDEGYMAANVVSGTRFNMSLQDLPKQVDVITSQFINDTGAVDLADALRYTPGVSANANSTAAVDDAIGFGVAIRGYGTTTYYRNGFRAYTNPDLMFVDRIEVIKGPSSTFSGTIEPGGTANVITARVPGSFSSGIKESFGSWDRSRTEVVVGGPLNASKSVGFRVGAAWEDWGGYTDYSERQKLVYGGTVEWAPFAKTKISVETQWTNQHAVPTNQTNALLSPDSTSLLNHYNHAFNRGGPNTFSDYFIGLGTLIIEQQLTPAWSLRGGMFFRYYDQYGLSIGGNNNITIDATGKRTVNRTATLATSSQQDLAPQVNLVGHLHYLGIQHQMMFAYDQFYAHQLSATRSPLAALSRIDIDNPGDAYTLPAVSLMTKYGGNTRLISVQRGYSFNNVFSLWNDRLTLMQGYRYGTSYYNVINHLTNGLTLADSHADVLNLGLSYRLTPTLSAYVSYSESYLPQRTFDFAGNLFKPITGSGVDYGLKYNLIPNRLSGSLVGFNVRRQNVTQPDPVHSGFNIQTGSDEGNGLEYSLLAKPLEHWQLVGAYTYMQTRVIADPFRLQNLGTRTSNIPRHAASLWNRYQLAEGALKGLSLGVGVSYVGNRRGLSTSADLRTLQSPGYTRVDASLGYDRRFGKHLLRLSARLNNLFDQDYLLSNVTYGEPINYMFSADLHF